METLYTIGHSNHTAERFLQLLRLHAITAIADVRSQPYSRYNPHFDREPLQSALKASGVQYVFLGNQLGARSDTPSCYMDGKVQFDRLARTPAFQEGLDRVEKGLASFRLALMCAEKDPLECHRAILVARHLHRRGLQVQHILEDGVLESQDHMLLRLASLLHLRAEEHHLFRTPQDLLDDAYALQEQRIAYQLRTAPDSSAA